MGRTIVPYRWIYEQQKTFWFQKLKKTPYEKNGRELLLKSAYFNDAGSNWGTGQVYEKMLFIVLFTQYNELYKIEKGPKGISRKK
jgi:hypothetical protein